MDITSTLTMNNGIDIPILGLGLYLSSSGNQAREALQTAVDAGYRHFDTAKFYGNGEDVGLAVRKSDLPREDLFVTTKLWNDDHGYDPTLAAIDLSLQKMQLDYIDLYLIHWPVQDLRADSWRAMEKALADGKIKSIGVSNYMIHHLTELLENCQIVPAINQFEISPYNYQSRKEVIEFCLSKNILVQAYSPLTKGHKLRDPALISLGNNYRKSPAQILIRWALQHQLIVLPKSSNEQRIRENADVFDFTLTDEDMQFLDGLDENLATSWDPTNTL
jgi:diketogulonate reductase-like aldo/keto reductase